MSKEGSDQLLSAAVDSAASRQDWDSLLTAMEQDPATKREWSRIWEWRDARDGTSVRKGGEDFTAGVMAAILKEGSPADSRVVQLPLNRPAARPAPAPVRIRSRSWKTWVPVSAAAGAAAAALIFTVGHPNLSASPAPAPQVASTTPVAVPVQAVRWTAGDDGQGKTPDADSAALLDAYLMEHSNTVAQHDVGGTLAGARFAAQTASYQAGE